MTKKTSIYMFSWLNSMFVVLFNGMVFVMAHKKKKTPPDYTAEYGIMWLLNLLTFERLNHKIK